MERTLDIHPLYKGTRFSLFPSHAQSNPSPASSSNTQSPGQVLRTFNHVRIQPSGPVDAFLRHGGGHQEVERGQISNRRNFASATRLRAGRPYSPTQRERSVHLPLPPRPRPHPGSLCYGFDVLLRARFPRSSSGLLSPHLDIYCRV